MRVLFPDISNPKTGKGFFLNELYRGLIDHNVDVVFGDAAHDVSLHNIRINQKTRKPKILRLDNVYYDLGKPKKLSNSGLKEGAEKADGVICQSGFSQDVVCHFLGIKKDKTTIIYNGCALGSPVDVPASSFEHNFTAISVWRPHKRLTDIIESFLMAELESSALWVGGDLSRSACDPTKYAGKPVFFKGHIKRRELVRGYFRMSKASIHLCALDACPNSVVEAISVNCPVICTNTGGTPELVKKSGGIVLNLDKPFPMKPIHLYNPPAIDKAKVADAIRTTVQVKYQISNEHINIKTVSEQYKRYFERFC